MIFTPPPLTKKIISDFGLCLIVWVCNTYVYGAFLNPQQHYFIWFLRFFFMKTSFKTINFFTTFLYFLLLFYFVLLSRLSPPLSPRRLRFNTTRLCKIYSLLNNAEKSLLGMWKKNNIIILQTKKYDFFLLLVFRPIQEF